MEQLMTARDVAGFLRVSQNYVYELASRGEPPSFKINGYRRFRVDDVDAWVQGHKSPRGGAPRSAIGKRPA